MILKEVLEKTTQHFKSKEFSTARLDAEILLGHALGLSRIEIYLQFERPLSEPELEKCRDVVRKRSQGEPVAYICGSKDFYKMNFAVGPGVLIPRPETEILIEKAVDWVKTNHADKKIKAFDFGAGSGCISLSLARELSHIDVFAVENSEKAAEYFLKNKEKHNISNCTLFQENVQNLDVEKIGAETVQLIVANPPYISESDTQVEEMVKKYEPKEALFSKDEGLADIKTWTQKASQLLAKGGACFFEIGADQGQKGLEIFAQNQLKAKILKDYSGRDRILFGEK